MRTLKTSEAAELLNVSPNTLRAWERRFGFPRPHRSPGKQRLYSWAQIAALSDALAEGLSISSAVSVARDAHVADARTLLNALASFRGDRADQAMESALALRSVESTLQDMLLPALESIRARQGVNSAPWAFAAAWSEDWLLRARRLAPRLTCCAALLIGDASAPPLDPARPYMLALELCCLRSGVDVLALPICAPSQLRDAVAALGPALVVICGSHATDDEVAHWAYQVRGSAGKLPLGLYHREIDSVNSRARARVLPPTPLEARSTLLAILEDSARWTADRRLSPVRDAVDGREIWSHSPPRAANGEALLAPRD